MLQVRVHGPGDVRVDDIAEPRPGTSDVVVRVAACGLCGSDLSYIEMGGLAGPGGAPMCLGHEMAGVVDWVGRTSRPPGSATESSCNRATTSWGGSATAPPRAASHPSSSSPRPTATGSTPSPTICRSTWPPSPSRSPSACVPPTRPTSDVATESPSSGAGPSDSAAIATLVDRGHERVVAVDLSPTRLELALGLGAQAAIDPTTTDVWGALADLHGTKPFMLGPTTATAAFIEASGAAHVITDVLDHGPVGGRLSVVALHYEPIPTSYLTVLMKQFTIRGSMEYPTRFADAIDLLDRRDLSALITHRFPLERFGDAVSMLGGSKECGKVLVSIDRTAR